MAEIALNDIPWDKCPHKIKFEAQLEHVSEMNEQVIHEIGAKLDTVTELIRQEIRHQSELTAQNIQMLRQDITQVAAIARSNSKRIETLEFQQGKNAIAAWKWVAGVAAGVLSGGGLGWIVTRILQG